MSAGGSSTARRYGTSSRVSSCWVTVSPVVPVPRVAPVTSTPLRYTQLMAVPSILSSIPHRTVSSSPSPRWTRAAHSRSSSSENALSSESIGSRCSNGGKASSMGAPTCWVGESGDCSDGCSASRASSSRNMASNDESSIVGSDRT